MQGVAVGRVIHYFPAADDEQAKWNDNNGPISATITRVWNADLGHINLTAFPDSHPPIRRQSVSHKAQVENKPDFKDGTIDYWDWPART